MSAQKATDHRRLLPFEVEADQAALHSRQAELEDLLAAAPATSWPEAVEKARYRLASWLRAPPPLIRAVASISDGVVTCEPKNKDRYGRVVAVCRAYGEDLSAWMAGLGWALAYREYSTQYVPAEDLARRRKSGMWSGGFKPPWEWRKRSRASRLQS